MSQWQQLANSLRESLASVDAPVAVTFTDDAPPTMSRFDRVVPAGCRFWQEAQSRAFVTDVQDHAMCPIGVHTHNLGGAPDGHEQQLKQALTAMAGLDYLRPSEVADVPTANRAARYVVYQPLDEVSSGPPDVVLLFARADQSLLISEAAQRVDHGAAPALGRPACAIVPQALNSQRAALSLGCCGARAYLDVLTDDRALWALPGPKLGAYVGALAKLASANATLTRFHRLRHEAVSGGSKPTIGESLDALSRCAQSSS